MIVLYLKGKKKFSRFL